MDDERGEGNKTVRGLLEMSQQRMVKGGQSEYSTQSRGAFELRLMAGKMGS